MDKSMVAVIPLTEYKELLDLKTRVNVAVERIWHDEFIKMEDILWVLNTEIACEIAGEMRVKAETERAKCRKKYREETAE